MTKIENDTPPPAHNVVGWIYEDELPRGYPYDAMFPHSKVDGVRMFPVFAPSPNLGTVEGVNNLGQAATQRAQIRAIVCGGRDYSDRQALFSALDELRPDVVIQGAAKGADALAFEWCRVRHVECWNMPADWKKHGKAAGPIRNRRMIEEHRANLVVAFPGGAGTADMIRQAEAASIKVIRYPELVSRGTK